MQSVYVCKPTQEKRLRDVGPVFMEEVHVVMFFIDLTCRNTKAEKWNVSAAMWTESSMQQKCNVAEA